MGHHNILEDFHLITSICPTSSPQSTNHSFLTLEAKVELTAFFYRSIKHFGPFLFSIFLKMIIVIALRNFLGST